MHGSSPIDQRLIIILDVIYLCRRSSRDVSKKLCDHLNNLLSNRKSGFQYTVNVGNNVYTHTTTFLHCALFDNVIKTFPHPADRAEVCIQCLLQVCFLTVSDRLQNVLILRIAEVLFIECKHSVNQPKKSVARKMG